MSTCKNIDKICIFAIVLALILTTIFAFGSSLGISDASKEAKYASTLFSTDKVHTIDIIIDDWEGFLATAESEEYSVCSVVIDGETFSNVGIRGKGNTSLSTVSRMDSDRYSFKIEFDQYDSGQNYYGLDKLCLNNIIQDNTYMKDYLTYQMMNEFGVAAPLCSYSYITVNGEDWGLYLAVEGVEEAFLQRNYGKSYGELYKPDSMDFGGGRGNGKGFEMPENLNPEFMPDMGNGGARGNGVDDGEAVPEQNPSEPRSNSEVFGERPVSPTDSERVPNNQADFGERASPPTGRIENSHAQEFGDSGNSSDSFDHQENFDGRPMPPTISDGAPNNLEELGEKPTPSTDGEGFPNREDFQGRGGNPMMSSNDVKLQYIEDDPDSYKNIFDNAKTKVNATDKARLISSLKKLMAFEDLDSIVDVDMALRYFVVHNFVVNGDSYTGSMVHNYYLYEEDGKLSMIPWDYNLAFGTFQGNNATATVNDDIDEVLSDRPMQAFIFSDEKYSTQYYQLYEEFLQKIDTAEIIDKTYELIKPFVEKDPSAFCSYQEFQQGVATLKEFCRLRALSVSSQLAGEEGTIDTGDLNLSDMGTMNMGRQQGSLR